MKLTQEQYYQLYHNVLEGVVDATAVDNERIVELLKSEKQVEELLYLVKHTAHAKTTDESWEASERCYDYLFENNLLKEDNYQGN